MKVVTYDGTTIRSIDDYAAWRGIKNCVDCGKKWEGEFWHREAQCMECHNKLGDAKDRGIDAGSILFC